VHAGNNQRDVALMEVLSGAGLSTEMVYMGPRLGDLVKWMEKLELQ